MYDIVFPKNNELNFIKQGKKLGYDKIVFIYTEKTFNSAPNVEKESIKYDIEIVKGCLCDKKFVESDYSISNSNRIGWMKQDVKLVFDIEESDHFMNQKDSGMNVAIAQQMKQYNCMYGINFSRILSYKDRFDLLGSFIQNIVLCNKYKVKVVFVSFAKLPLEMRNPEDLKAFGRILGLDRGENL